MLLQLLPQLLRFLLCSSSLRESRPPISLCCSQGLAELKSVTACSSAQCNVNLVGVLCLTSRLAGGQQLTFSWQQRAVTIFPYALLRCCQLSVSTRPHCLP